MFEKIFEVILLPILGVLTTYVVYFIRSKINELQIKTTNELDKKYLTMLDETIASCVMATKQTYVDSLKKQGKFDSEAQTVAFEETKQKILELLTEESKAYLEELFEDLDAAISIKIEKEVALTK